MRDGQRQPEAGDDEVANDLDLRRGERAVPLVASKHRGRELPGANGLLARGVAQDRGEGDREIAHVSRMVHVAEVDEPGDAARADQDVRQRDVGMVEPGGERAGRLGGGCQPRQDPGEPRAQVADGIQDARPAQHRGGAAHVPVEGAVAGAVEQALQGQAGAGGQGPDLRRELAGDGLAFRGLAREDGYQPGQARAAGGVGDWLDGGP